MAQTRTGRRRGHPVSDPCNRGIHSTNNREANSSSWPYRANGAGVRWSSPKSDAPDSNRAAIEADLNRTAHGSPDRQSVPPWWSTEIWRSPPTSTDPADCNPPRGTCSGRTRWSWKQRASGFGASPVGWHGEPDGQRWRPSEFTSFVAKRAPETYLGFDEFLQVLLCDGTAKRAQIGEFGKFVRSTPSGGDRPGSHSVGSAIPDEFGP